MYAGRDIAHEYKNAYSLVPAVRTANANGDSVDCRDCGPDVTSVLNVGAVSGTSATCNVKLQESDDDSTWSDISGAAHTEVDEANQCDVITAVRSKRYVRSVATLAADDTPSFACGVTIHSPKVSY